MTTTKETKAVEITLGGVTRQLEIMRYSAQHCWHAQNVTVLCRFGRGTKVHGISNPQVVERNGKFVFCVQSFRNRNVAVPYAYEGAAAAPAPNSGWTGHKQS